MTLRLSLLRDDGFAKTVMDDPGHIVRCISADRRIAILPTHGKRTIASSSGIFAQIDQEFHLHQSPARLTGVTEVEIFELVGSANYCEIFESFGRPIDELCLTQDQIVSYAETYPTLFPADDVISTFFLFKSGSCCYIPRIRRSGSSRMIARCSTLAYEPAWPASQRHRIVIPR